MGIKFITFKEAAILTSLVVVGGIFLKLSTKEFLFPPEKW